MPILWLPDFINIKDWSEKQEAEAMLFTTNPMSVFGLCPLLIVVMITHISRVFSCHHT